MTDTTRLDAALSAWLREESAARAPERLIHETRTLIAATPQRRVLRGPLPWPRSISWRPVATLAVIGAVVLAVVSLSIYLPRNGPAVSPSPSAPSTPRPLATLSVVQPYECQRARGTCLGPLAAGVYQPTTFRPKVRFSVPAGWSNEYDVADQFDLTLDVGGQYTYPDGITFSDSVSFFADPLAESATDRAPLAGVGATAADLAQWLATHNDLVASTPEQVSLGGASGYSLQISLPAGARSTPDHCTSDHGEPRCASLFVGADPQSNYGFGLVGPETAVVYLLDLPGGGTLLVVIDDVDGVDAAGLVTAATPIVESIGFAP